MVSGPYGGPPDDPVEVPPAVEVLPGVGLLAAAGLSFVVVEAVDPFLDGAGSLEPVLRGVFFSVQVACAGAGLWLLGRGLSLPAYLDPPWGRRRRSPPRRGGLLRGRAVGGSLPEALALALFILFPSMLVWAAVVVALWGPGGDLSRGALGAAGGYVLVGLVTTLTGIPGYVGLGAPFLLPFWPAYWLGLHECTFGVGLWACPSG